MLTHIIWKQTPLAVIPTEIILSNTIDSFLVDYIQLLTITYAGCAGPYGPILVCVSYRTNFWFLVCFYIFSSFLLEHVIVNEYMSAMNSNERLHDFYMLCSSDNAIPHRTTSEITVLFRKQTIRPLCME